MNHRGQRALRDGDWKYLRVDGHDYLFDLPADERERANLGQREPAAAGGDARRLGGVERDHAADSRRRDREPRLRREGHAAALAALPGAARRPVATIADPLPPRHLSTRAMTAAEEPRVDAAPVRRFRDPNYRPQAATLGALRERIDALDAQIVALLAERALCVRDATRFKRDAFQVAAPERQAAVFARVRALAADRAAEFPGAARRRRGGLSRARRRLHRRRGALLRRNRADSDMTSSTFLARRAAVAPRRLRAAARRQRPASPAAQTGPWPNRPIRIVVPYAAGSSPDVFVRIVAEKIGPKLGQQVLVENRAGAGGNTGTGAVAKSPGDGYTFVISTNGPLVYNTVLYKKLGYDPFTELRPVVLGGAQANVCAVRSDSGITSLGELVKAMKANPGKFNFSSTGVGSLSQLGVELLKAKTNTFAVHIPYASSPLAILALLQGDVQFACVPAVAVMPQVKAGKLRPLAVSTAKRSALTPGDPDDEGSRAARDREHGLDGGDGAGVDAERGRRAHEPGDQRRARRSPTCARSSPASSWSRWAARPTTCATS